MALINFAQLMAALRKRVDLGGAAQWALYLARCLLAAALCGAAAYAFEHWLVVPLPDSGCAPRAWQERWRRARSPISSPRIFLRLQESRDAFALLARRFVGPARA